ncbi:Thioredoxin-like protein YtpP [Listeria monocytogenes]|nr:Thioredoxin-like protein YtpP [Listeria monocytogenes]
MKNLESVEQFNAIKSEGKSVFMFSADWCGDCKFIEPVCLKSKLKTRIFPFIMLIEMNLLIYVLI